MVNMIIDLNLQIPVVRDLYKSLLIFVYTMDWLPRVSEIEVGFPKSTRGLGIFGRGIKR